jgi:hypothetical protein
MRPVSHACCRRVAFFLGLLVCGYPSAGFSRDQANSTERGASAGQILPLQGTLTFGFNEAKRPAAAGETPTSLPANTFESIAKRPRSSEQSQLQSSRAARCFSQSPAPCRLAIAIGLTDPEGFVQIFRHYAESIVLLIVAVCAAAVGLAKRIGRGSRRP